MSDTHSEKSFFDKSRRPFLMRKIHSLTGVAPVGAYMVFHLWENSKALQGQHEYDEMVKGITKMPYLPLLEATILLPLLFHAVYGVKLALEGRPNVRHYTYSRNWMYTLQRTTGILAFLFIGFHLYEYWWQKVLGKLAHDQFYTELCARMSSSIGPVPVTALIYVFGIAACVFHFVNGLWGFCFSWGITVSRRSQRAAALVLGLAGIAIFLLGANTAIYFATGARLAVFGVPKSTARTCAEITYVPAGGEPRLTP